jgi:hypothetical protein
MVDPERSDGGEHGSRAQRPKQVAGLPDVGANQLQRDREPSALMLCYTVLASRGGAEMPIMQEGRLRAARAHDHADARAGDRGLCLGASGR